MPSIGRKFANRYRLTAVVTVVDAPAVSAGRFASDVDAVNAQRAEDEALDHESPLEELFEDQINCADLIVLNKTDLFTRWRSCRKVETSIKSEATRPIKIIRSGVESVPGADILLGLGSWAVKPIWQARKSHHDMHHEDGHEHHHDHDHDHDEFISFLVQGGSLADANLGAKALSEIIERHDILRLKGFAAVAGKPMRLSIQAVGSSESIPILTGTGRVAKHQSTNLVVIGLHTLDRDAVGQEIQALFVLKMTGVNSG